VYGQKNFFFAHKLNKAFSLPASFLHNKAFFLPQVLVAIEDFLNAEKYFLQDHK